MRATASIVLLFALFIIASQTPLTKAQNDSNDSNDSNDTTPTAAPTDDSNDSNDTTETAAPTEAPAENTTNDSNDTTPTEAPTVNDTEAPTVNITGDDSVAPTESPTDAPADNDTEENSTEENSTEENSTEENSTEEDNTTEGNSTEEDNTTEGNTTEEDNSTEEDNTTNETNSTNETGDRRVFTSRRLLDDDECTCSPTASPTTGGDSDEPTASSTDAPTEPPTDEGEIALTMSMSLAGITADEFDTAAQTSFKEQIAVGAGSDYTSDDVWIESFSRRSLSVTFKIYLGTADYDAASSLETSMTTFLESTDSDGFASLFETDSGIAVTVSDVSVAVETGAPTSPPSDTVIGSAPVSAGLSFAALAGVAAVLQKMF